MSDGCCFCKTPDNQGGKFQRACSTARTPHNAVALAALKSAIKVFKVRSSSAPSLAEAAGTHFSNSRFSLIRGIDYGYGQPQINEGPMYNGKFANF